MCYGIDNIGYVVYVIYGYVAMILEIRVDQIRRCRLSYYSYSLTLSQSCVYK